MTDAQPSPPRFAQTLLRMFLRPSDAESIPGDLLEEYRDVRFPSLGQLRADAWYIKHVLSVLWRVMCPWVVAIVALRIISFPLPGGWNPSLVPAPGVSALDALIFFSAGYFASHRTGRFGTGVVTAAATSLIGFKGFVVYASVAMPGLLLAPFEKPFIFVIMTVLLVIALSFGIAAGAVGAAVGRWWLPGRRAA